MIKVFTLNKNKKIELTETELKSLLDEAYWEGRNDANRTYIYTTPSYNDPFKWSTSPYYTTTTSTSGTVTLNSPDYITSNDTINTSK